MAAPGLERKEQSVQGEFSTAEITHLIESVEIETVGYIRNHVAMRLAGVEGPIRQFHDNVTRANLERLVGVYKEIGIPAPVVKPVEERENEIKAKLQNANVEGTLTEGEVLRDVALTAKQNAVFYTVSCNLATHPKVKDVFRRNLEATLDIQPKIMEASRNTKEFVTPPLARNLQLVGAVAKGVPAGEVHRKR